MVEEDFAVGGRQCVIKPSKCNRISACKRPRWSESLRIFIEQIFGLISIVISNKLPQAFKIVFNF